MLGPAMRFEASAPGRRVGRSGEAMPLTKTNLGHVLRHIYEFPFEGAIYLQDVERYAADTPCIVAWAGDYDEAVLHQVCLSEGFKNWLNVAVVSDTCDEVSEQTEACLVAAF